MLLILASVVILLLCGTAALLFRQNHRIASQFGVAGPVLACVFGLIPVVRVLSGGTVVSVHAFWSMPFGAFSVGLDGLSAFFLLPILVLGALSSIYGLGYLSPYREQKPLGASWFQFNALVASMILVILARNA